MIRERPFQRCIIISFLLSSASHVLDEVSEVCAERITHLTVVNTSRRPLSLLAIATFVNLRTLVVSPHNLGDDLVECFGNEIFIFFNLFDVSV